MKRKKQLLCLILALSYAISCIMPLAVSAEDTVYKFIINPSAEYTQESATGITYGQPFTIDTAQSGASITLPQASKSGYGFNGWTYRSDFRDDANSVTMQITPEWIGENEISNSHGDPWELFPVFGRTVNWHFQNGTDDDYSEFIPGMFYFDYDDLMHLDLTSDYLYVSKKTMTDFGTTEIIYPHHRFSHWSDSENGTVDVFDNTETEYKFGSDTTVSSDTVDLYAVWREHPKFDPNGGAWGENSSVAYGELNMDGQYSITAPEYEYREFEGWFETKYTSDVPDDAVAVSTFQENKTYYAGWKKTQYSLEYVNLLPGADNSQNPTTYTKADVSTNPIILAPAVKSGYGFDGWYATSSNDGVSANTRIERITDTSTEYNPWKLFAKWYYKLKDENVTGYVGTPITPITLALDDESLTDGTFSIAEGYTLPAGITLENGVISGTPTAPYRGSVKLDITPTRTDGITVHGSQINFNITNVQQSSGGGSRTVYTVKFESNGGSSVENQRVRRYQKAKEPQAPIKDGYELDGWYSDEALTQKFDFSKQIIKNTTLYAKWNVKNDNGEENGGNNGSDNNGKKNPFKDVTEDDWFYDDVNYVNNNGLMNGISNGVFAPHMLITRGMFVTVLYRMEGSPTVKKSVPFEDINLNAYYADAVIWAKENGIVKGMNEKEFAPNDSVTREQIATLMLRYAQYKDIAPTGAWAIKLEYSDTDKISDYAVEGVMYCTLKKIMQGKDANRFAPADGATRAEIAAIIRRFIENNK